MNKEYKARYLKWNKICEGGLETIMGFSWTFFQFIVIILSGFAAVSSTILLVKLFPEASIPVLLMALSFIVLISAILKALFIALCFFIVLLILNKLVYHLRK